MTRGYTDIITLNQYKRVLNPWGRREVEGVVCRYGAGSLPERESRSEMSDREYFCLYQDEIFHHLLFSYIVIAWIWKMQRRHSSGNAHGHKNWFFGQVHSCVHISLMATPSKGPHVNEANFVRTLRLVFDRLYSELEKIDASVLFAPEHLLLCVLHKMLLLSFSELAVIFGCEEQEVEKVVSHIHSLLTRGSHTPIDRYESIETKLPQSYLFAQFQ